MQQHHNGDVTEKFISGYMGDINCIYRDKHEKKYKSDHKIWKIYIHTQLTECLSVCFTSLCKKQYHKKSKIEQESYEKASWKERDICKEI